MGRISEPSTGSTKCTSCEEQKKTHALTESIRICQLDVRDGPSLHGNRNLLTITWFWWPPIRISNLKNLQINTSTLQIYPQNPHHFNQATTNFGPNILGVFHWISDSLFCRVNLNILILLKTVGFLKTVRIPGVFFHLPNALQSVMLHAKWQEEVVGSVLRCVWIWRMPMQRPSNHGLRRQIFWGGTCFLHPKKVTKNKLSSQVIMLEKVVIKFILVGICCWAINKDMVHFSGKLMDTEWFVNGMEN